VLALGVGAALTLLLASGVVLAAARIHLTRKPAVPRRGAPNRVPDGDWSRFDFNAARTGVGPRRTGITPRNLSALRARVIHLDGTVDSSPIQLAGIKIRGHRDDVVVVTTAYGRTIAIDPRTGKRLWQFTPNDIGSYQGSAQITTATPVADPDRRYVYAASPDGLIRKLSIASGHPVWATRVTFSPSHEKVASALNISGSSVVVTTGGYIGDVPPYQGHVVLIDRATGHRTHVWNALCAHRKGVIQKPGSCPASDAAIWGRAGAVIAPGSSRILVSTGNAPFNGSTNWGDSLLELSPKLRPIAHWTPRNQSQLNHGDLDLGSTAPALLPGGLAVQGGKAGVLSLVSLHRLPSMHGSGGHRLGGELQDLPTPGGDLMFTAPVVWRHAHRTYLFAATGSSTDAYVLDAHHRLRMAWQRSLPGTSPVLAGGLLYVFSPSGGQLNVLAPTTGRTLRSLPAAVGHWNSPIVVGGRIMLPVGDANAHQTGGEMFIFHLPGR
jgi:outer membrane protein assembly factor BamB